MASFSEARRRALGRLTGSAAPRYTLRRIGEAAPSLAISSQARSTTISARPTAVVVPPWKRVSGEYAAPVSWSDKRDVCLSDPNFYDAVYSLSDKVREKDWYIVTSETADPNQKIRDALQEQLDVIRWGDQRQCKGFTTLFAEIIPEMVWGGLSILEMLPDADHVFSFNRFELSTLWKFMRDESGTIINFYQNPAISVKPLDPNKFIWWPWRVTDRNPYGFGLLHPFFVQKLDYQGNTIPPMYQIKWQIENDIRRILHRYGSPRSVYSVEGATDEQIEEISEALRDPDVDASFAYNGKVTVAQDTIGRATGMDPFLEFMNKIFQVGTGSARQTITASGSFNRSSAETAQSETNPLVWDLQRTTKTIMEAEVLDRLVLQSGYAPSMIKAKFFWGTPGNLDFASVVRLLGENIISKQTCHDILRDQFGLKIPDDELNRIQSEAKQQAAIDAAASPVRPVPR